MAATLAIMEKASEFVSSATLAKTFADNETFELPGHPANSSAPTRAIVVWSAIPYRSPSANASIEKATTCVSSATPARTW